MENLITLRDVLINANDFSWSDSLFLPKDKVWSLNSECAVLNTDDLRDDEEVPVIAAENSLIYALSIQIVQDIVDNAQAQRPQCSDNELFEAFQYYYENDAFISFENNP